MYLERCQPPPKKKYPHHLYQPLTQFVDVPNPHLYRPLGKRSKFHPIKEEWEDCFLSIPSENIRKPEGFWFSGDIEKNISLKWVNSV